MKKLLFLLLIPFVFACSKDDETVEKETKVRISSYRMSGTDSVPHTADIYIFKGQVQFSDGIDLLEKALSSYEMKNGFTSAEFNLEPGTYTVAIQLPLSIDYGPGTCSYKTFEIQEGESLILKKTFKQYSGSYTLEPWNK